MYSNFAYIHRWNQINLIIGPLLILLPHLFILMEFLPLPLPQYFTPPPPPAWVVMKNNITVFPPTDDNYDLAETPLLPSPLTTALTKAHTFSSLMPK